jgi:hypothetical protein
VGSAYHKGTWKLFFASDTLFDRQQRLRSRLVNEQRYHNVTEILADSEPKDRAMYLVLQAVVCCILHLENHIGLKSIESILSSGISNARRGALDWILATRVNRCQEEYVNCISKVVRTQILGTTIAHSQWLPAHGGWGNGYSIHGQQPHPVRYELN